MQQLKTNLTNLFNECRENFHQGYIAVLLELQSATNQSQFNASVHLTYLLISPKWCKIQHVSCVDCHDFSLDALH